MYNSGANQASSTGIRPYMSHWNHDIDLFVILSIIDCRNITFAKLVSYITETSSRFSLADIPFSYKNNATMQ